MDEQISKYDEIELLGGDINNVYLRKLIINDSENTLDDYFIYELILNENINETYIHEVNFIGEGKKFESFQINTLYNYDNVNVNVYVNDEPYNVIYSINNYSTIYNAHESKNECVIICEDKGFSVVFGDGIYRNKINKDDVIKIEWSINIQKNNIYNIVNYEYKEINEKELSTYELYKYKTIQHTKELINLLSENDVNYKSCLLEKIIINNSFKIQINCFELFNDYILNKIIKAYSISNTNNIEYLSNDRYFLFFSKK